MSTLQKAIIMLPICIVFALAHHHQAVAAGFAFNWRPFAVDKNLGRDAENQFLPDERPFLFPERFFSFGEEKPSFDYEKNKSENVVKTEKKSSWDNVKIVFSPADDKDRNQRRNFYFIQEDEQASRFLNSLHALIHDDEKIKSLEEIGKIIEPQIKFYLEF
ncbi:MAG TPA: hypothetical protein P5040_02230 [Smithella sp.]|nr:hypothetical protein [Smithella sp.]HRS96972.1 hypothetical protein [Smithella sp.]